MRKLLKTKHDEVKAKKKAEKEAMLAHKAMMEEEQTKWWCTSNTSGVSSPLQQIFDAGLPGLTLKYNPDSGDITAYIGVESRELPVGTITMGGDVAPYKVEPTVERPIVPAEVLKQIEEDMSDHKFDTSNYIIVAREEEEEEENENDKAHAKEDAKNVPW